MIYKSSNVEILDHVLNNTNPKVEVAEPILYQVLRNWISNTYEQKALRNPVKYARWLTVREACEDILQGWCMRL